jgi:serine protease Do
MTSKTGSAILSALVFAGASLMSLPAAHAAAPVAAPTVTGLPDFADLVDKVGPAVVNIRTTERVRLDQGGPDEEMQEFLRRFFGGQMVPRGRRGGPAEQPQEERVQRGVGSGFIISDDGYVLTNAHVVEGADEVVVTLTDRREFKAKVLGSDARSDVAVNPGNSGGPLINMRGEVIGINSQIATLSGAYNGISFAVPIDEVMRVTDQIRKTGKVTRGRLGVQISEVTTDVAESLGLGRARGAEVAMVEPGGPADKAGVKVGDIILKFNGKDIDRSSDLPRLVGGSAVGSRASVTVWRRGSQLDLPVTIVELQEEKSPTARATPKKPAPDQAPNALGLHVSDLSAVQKRELKTEAGVLVEFAEGRAASAGIRQGDVIQQMNNVEITGAAQFNGLVAKLDAKKPVALLVRRDNVSRYLVIRPRP